MKKCILLGFVFLSAIGARAEEEINYPTSITYGNVVYDLTHHEDDDVVNGYYINITGSTVKADNATVDGSIIVNTTANATRTNTFCFNAMATGVDGGTNVVYSLELNNFVASEILTPDPVQQDGTITLGDGAYAATMELAKVKDPNIYSFDEISVLNKYFWFVTEYDEDEDLYVTKKYSSNDSLALKAAYPKYREGYYYLNPSKNNYYLINKVNHTETTNYTTTNQYDCQVTAISPSFRIPSTVTNVTLGSEITRIPNASIFSEAKQLALITVSSYNDEYKFRDGILYRLQYGTNNEKEIVTATTSLIDQTLAESIDSIYTDAFKNAPQGVVITSMNYNLYLNGNEKFKVVFLIPDQTATIEEAANGGYIVKGNLTNEHIKTLEIKGTYMDFRQANILTDIVFENASSQKNTLLYFEKPAKSVTGDKNVIVDGVCENCIILDKPNQQDKFYCPWDFTAKWLDYDRSFDNMWKTTCLPFNVSEEDLNGRLIMGKLNSFDYNTYTFDFRYIESATANTPYIVKSAWEGQSQQLVNLQNITVKATEPKTVNAGAAYFKGVFERQQLFSSLSEEDNYYGIQNIWDPDQKCYRNHLQLCEGVHISPFRAYLQAWKPLNSSAAKFRLLDAMDQLIEEGEMPISTSGIEEVTETKTSKATYNLNGQKVNNAHRGLNIVNGKVVLNK